MQNNVARRPRFKRVSNFPRIRLTDRDRLIVVAVLQYRFLTTSQILSLVPGSRQNVRRRLQRLYHAGFLERPRLQLSLRFEGELRDFVYSATRKTLHRSFAFPCRTASEKDFKPVTSLFLAHALAVSDALIFIQQSCRVHGAVFIPERDIIASVEPEDSAGQLRWQVTIKLGTTTERIGVIPDAVFAVEQEKVSGERRRLYYFLEVDRGTMPVYRKSIRLSSIRRKALAYSQSRRSKCLKEHWKIPGFQVLFVTRTKDRIEAIKRICREATGGHDTYLFRFATQADLATDETIVTLGMV